MTTTKLQDIYPSAYIRGTRISRLGDQDLGQFRLTTETVSDLATSNAGIFVGGFRSFEQILNRIRQLDEVPAGGQWVVVPSTKKCSAAIRQLWLSDDSVSYISPKNLPGIWHSKKVSFCVPESLREFGQLLKPRSESIAAIVLVDNYCRVHTARGFNNGSFRVQNDRPQAIMNFRASCSDQSWVPPMFVFTEKLAKATPTLQMQGAYGLDTFVFIDGATVRCGDVSRKRIEDSQFVSGGTSIATAC